MHELSVAEEIVNISRQYLPKENNVHVKSITIKIGRLSNILPDSLLFCYESLIDNTPLNGSKLIIEEIPIRINCMKCGKNSEIDNFSFVCPKCNSSEIEIESGTELLISEIELFENNLE